MEDGRHVDHKRRVDSGRWTAAGAWTRAGAWAEPVRGQSRCVDGAGAWQAPGAGPALDGPAIFHFAVHSAVATLPFHGLNYRSSWQMFSSVRISEGPTRIFWGCREI
jgi:hypothetical protein